MTMTPDAKSELSKTIRKIRERLLIDLHDANERAYRLGVPIAKAKLNEEATIRRQRMEAWIDEQIRAETGDEKRDAMAFRRDIEKQAAYTFLNRIVILRLMEAWDLRGPAVATKGWDSKGYKDFRQLARSLVQVDTETEGFGFLLKLIFEDLATDLPGLYGSNGLADQVPIPPATMRFVIESLDEPVMDSCWTDDMTLGWVYQYWNDPEREALDAKINDGGKIEPHEIASKTQMFTERYMVDWLLQNSLGPMWLAICKKHGWTPDAESTGTLDELEKRRVEWRAKRDAGEVELTDLMPLHTDLERQWAYYVPQPIPDDAVEHANDSVRDLKILDPAVGSGHFLVAAFDLLHALYQEEARHRGETELAEKWSEQAIVERILEHNLNGIDLDSRAVQIAAAALWMKAKLKCESAHPVNLNLVASNLGIARLPHNDPALVELRRAVEEETGIPANLTNQIIEALQGADHLGSLLKVDDAIESAIAAYEERSGWKNKAVQLTFDDDGKPVTAPRAISREWATSGILSAIESFLAKHSSGSDLGLRLHGEELAKGVRFLRINQVDKYDLVVANPPYQGTGKMSKASYVEDNYEMGKPDLFAAFLLRGLQFTRHYGTSAMLTMRNWMFIRQYVAFRDHLLRTYDLRAIGDFAVGAFGEVPNDILTVAVSVFTKTHPRNINSVATQPTLPSDTSYDRQRTKRKRAAALAQVGRYEFRKDALSVVPEWPLVYWWNEQFLDRYISATKLGDESDVKQGMATANNTRFLRFPWEVDLREIYRCRIHQGASSLPSQKWVPYIKGAAGQAWFEPLNDVINWDRNGLENRLLKGATAGKNNDYYFLPSVNYSTIGANFTARAGRYRSIFDVSGSSVFPSDVYKVCCFMNSSLASEVITSLNPTVNFQVGDIKRLPILDIEGSEKIRKVLRDSFDAHEHQRETSVEFLKPRSTSSWQAASDWAMKQVNRDTGTPLTDFEQSSNAPSPHSRLGFAFGVAMGRYSKDGTGLVEQPDDLSEEESLPNGICFLNGAQDNDKLDGLGHASTSLLKKEWASVEDKDQLGAKTLRGWLRTKFFSDRHCSTHENRPIFWPLSSKNRTFVAYVNIHQLDDKTLTLVLADHLMIAQTKISGELEDLRKSRAEGEKSSDNESRFADLKKYETELTEFIETIQQCAQKGPPPTDQNCPAREVDATYSPRLDDGVMINSSALWPALEPAWDEPKLWWEQLAKEKGYRNKHYDWSHMAMRYWPTRVDEKCRSSDFSMSVAHGCFWKYHPAKAWAWELQLQDEIASDFRIGEGPYRGDSGDMEHRDKYLAENAAEAIAAIEKEMKRKFDAINRKIKNGFLKEQDYSFSEIEILESGLWTAEPKLCWDVETKIIKKQKAPFRIVAPDEQKARKQLLRECPELAKPRNQLLNKYESMFADEAREEVAS